MKARPIVLSSLIAFAVGIAMLIVPTAASAAPVSPGPATRVASTMTVVGFDRDVAARNGFEIKTNSAGQEYSVQKGATGAAAQPQNTVYGDCGSSYVQVTPLGSRKALIQTGFSVYTVAWDHSWTVHVVDNYGVSNKNWGGPMWSSSWVGTNNFTSSGTGYVYTQVTTGIAWLIDGAICFSGGPTASANIF